MVGRSFTTQQPDELTLRIGGRDFRGFSGLKLTTSIETFWTLSLTAPFEPDNAAHRATFRPYSYQDVDVLMGGKQLFPGTMLTAIPSFDSQRSAVEVVCYARPAVINDSVFPEGTTEFKGLNLRQVTEALIAPWGLRLQMNGDPGPAFESVTIERTDKVGPFIVELAKQRGFLVSNTRDGKLLLHKPKKSRPFHRFKLGEQPLFSLEVGEPKPQEFWSSVTGFTPAKTGRDGVQYKFDNPHLDNLRPHAVELTDTDDADCQDATARFVGRMLANAATYTMSAPTWLVPAGNAPILAGETLGLLAPRAMIYRSYDFIVRNSVLERSGTKTACSLELAIPEAFDGEMPRRMPWDE